MMSDKFTTKTENNIQLNFLMFLSLTNLNWNSNSVPRSAIKKYLVWNKKKCSL